ncbi:MAG TPA: peptidase E [Miltoncostaeaceae bacterium]|nr:peptidase E [Miltoncostaeaceae bacterium]
MRTASPARRRTPRPRRPPPRRPQVVALGGGGFTDDPGCDALDRYVLEVTGRDAPRVCFLPTAGGDQSGYVVRFYRAFTALGARPSHLPLFNRTAEDLRAPLLEQDAIYVGGGNTAALLAVWRVHGVDALLREAWSRGVVLAGLCAGAQCWFEAGVTASWGPRLAPLRDGLGVLPGSVCPHYGTRREAYHRFVAQGLPGGIGVDDGAALHYVGGTLSRVVTSRAGATAHRVARDDGRVTETRLPATPLVPGAGGGALLRLPGPSHRGAAAH